MAWTLYASTIETADLTGISKSIRFKPSANTVLEGLFTWLVFKNVGTFTGLTVKIYSDRNQLPGAVVATSSTSYTKAEILTTYDNGVKYIPFSFSPRISLNKNTYYHIVLSASGYTFSEAAHMAWVKAWPDPIYNQPAAYDDLGPSAYMFGIIGDEL